MALGRFTELIQTVFRRPRIGFRAIIGTMGVAIAVGGYYYVIDLYDPESNVFSRFRSTPKQVTFFSGSPGGFYTRIGKTLESASDLMGSRVRVRDHATAGGSENAIKVLVTPMSLGLVQEDTLREGDFIRSQLRYVAPLYLERMHVLYRADRVDNWDRGRPLRLSASTDERVLAFFAGARIDAGSVGSGTRVIASYFLSEINAQIQSVKVTSQARQEVFGHATKEAYRRLKSEDPEERLDVVFSIAGAPLPEVRELLADKKDGIDIRLISVDPSMVARINERYGVNLRTADFKGIYSDDIQPDVSTIGSYAFLVAHLGIANSDLLAVLRTLYERREDIRSDMGLQAGDHFQLNEFDFYDAFRSEHEASRLKTLQNVMIFLVTVSVSSAAVIAFLLWIVSSIKQGAYFQEVSRIYAGLALGNIGIDAHVGVFGRPLIEANQSVRISQISNAQREVRALLATVYQDYRTGGITDLHHQNLVRNMERLMGELRDQLAQRLNEALESGVILPREEIRAFYTVGFLSEPNYRALVAGHFAKRDDAVQALDGCPEASEGRAA